MFPLKPPGITVSQNVPDKSHLSGNSAIPAGEQIMAEMESLYRKVDGRILIELKLTSVVQLFNSFDPAPFHERELDASAEDYIVDIVDDFPLDTPFQIIIHLPADIAGTDRAEKIPQAIHAHFRFRMMEQDLKYRSRFRHGKWALLVGLIFVTIAMIARQVVYTALGSAHLLSQIIADALLIIGWAAMWEPVTVLLYELWPIIQQKKIYEKISTIEVQVLPIP
jgi:hypothetical protein